MIPCTCCSRCLRAACCIAALTALAAGAPGQSTTPDEVPRQPDPAGEAAPLQQHAPTTGAALPPAPEERAPLLREGSFIVRAIGTLQREPLTGRWVFHVEPREPDDAARDLILLPCALLDEIERMTAAATGHRLTLEMTGEIFVYGNRNYLMPTHPPLVVAHEPQDEQPADGEESGPEEQSDRAEDIIRELERSAGPMTRRPESRSRDRSDIGAAARNAWREGTIIVERRGRVRRLADGAYIFVLDSDAEGLSDPPLILLPCQLLERLARHERESAEESALLLNGHVYVYQGQSYLLATLYRVPRERTPLVP